MTSSACWKSSLSFSERTEKITSWATEYRNSDDTAKNVNAVQLATRREKNAYQNASSREDYEELLKLPLIKSYNLGSCVQPTGTLDDPREGDTFGKYVNAVFYRDGSSSTVYKARAPPDDAVDAKGRMDASTVALKVTVPCAQQPPHDFKREVRMLQRAKHPAIVPLHEVFQQPGGRFILVFPFIPYDLDQLIHDSHHSIPRNHVKSVLRSLFAALAHIHSLGIIHRDVKPSNLLLRSPSGPAYLADFGIAWAPDDPASEPADKKITDVGTTCYRPPELLFGNTKYGFSLDMWAAGCLVAEAGGVGSRDADKERRTLFEAGAVGSELALVKSMFETLGTPTLEEWPEAANFTDWGKMLFKQYSPRPWSEILPQASESESDLVSKLVVYESGSRLTARQALQHSFFDEK